MTKCVYSIVDAGDYSSWNLLNLQVNSAILVCNSFLKHIQSTQSGLEALVQIPLPILGQLFLQCALV